VIRMDLRERAWGVWIGFDRLRIGTSGGLLWVRWWTFGFLRHGVRFWSRSMWTDGCGDADSCTCATSFWTRQETYTTKKIHVGNQAPRHENLWGNGGWAPRIPNLSRSTLVGRHSLAGSGAHWRKADRTRPSLRAVELWLHGPSSTDESYDKPSTYRRILLPASETGFDIR
jgi:hypothetical protein